MASGYWSQTRLNGAPLDNGDLCWVTEVDGQNPIATYGKTEQEIINKLSHTNAHAQAALARRTSVVPPVAPGTTLPAPARTRLTSDEVMQATVDMQNPATAGRAVARLVQDETGIDLGQLALHNFQTLAMAWQKNNPTFYAHPGNKRLLTDQAKAYVGGDLTMITAEIMTRAYQVLQQRGELLTEPVALPPNPNEPPTPPSPSFPGESPVQRTERDRGAPFATGARSTSLRGSQVAPPKTPKYTPEQIRTMPESKMRELIESNDPDYNAACELLYGNAVA